MKFYLKGSKVITEGLPDPKDCLGISIGDLGAILLNDRLIPANMEVLKKHVKGDSNLYCPKDLIPCEEYCRSCIESDYFEVGDVLVYYKDRIEKTLPEDLSGVLIINDHGSWYYVKDGEKVPSDSATCIGWYLYGS